MTFVSIYAVTPETVVVGYTPGYMGVGVEPGGTVVYGTGYVYPAYVGTTVFYPVPVTYGYAANVTYTLTIPQFALSTTSASFSAVAGQESLPASDSFQRPYQFLASNLFQHVT